MVRLRDAIEAATSKEMSLISCLLVSLRLRLSPLLSACQSRV
jgi:hypothetical protein